MVNGFLKRPLNIFAKSSILDVCLGSEYVFGLLRHIEKSVIAFIEAKQLNFHNIWAIANGRQRKTWNLNFLQLIKSNM